MGERKNSEQVKCRFLKYSETNFSLEVEGRGHSGTFKAQNMGENKNCSLEAEDFIQL